MNLSSPGLPGVLTWRAEAQPDRVALRVDGAAALTFGDWDARSWAVAADLVRRRVPARARVGLVFSARDWVEFAVAYVGVQRAACVAVPLSDRLAGPQLVQRLAHCDAALVVHGPGTAPAPSAPASVPVVGLAQLEDGGRPWAGDCDALSDGRPLAGGDLAQILYTSGTTRAPRAVGASHANLVPAFRADLRRLALGHSDVLVHAFVVGTNAAQTMLVNALTARPTVLTLARPTPARFARLIESSGAGTVFLVPSTAIELLRSGALVGRDLCGVHLVGCTAAALPGAVAAELAATFPRATIVNYYTSTEAAPAVATMIFDPARPECVGRAAPGTLRVCDRQGRPLPVGEVGEVWLRSPHARSYLGDPAADRATFGAGGWVRMGDLGHLDGEGFLHLTGRDDDVVKTGSFKVSAAEVEAALFAVPWVGDAAVLGVPHPVLGAVLAAVIVPRPGVPGDTVTLPAVRAALATHLSDHELPQRLAVAERLPRNDGGKVVKRDLIHLFDPAPRPEGRTVDVQPSVRPPL